MFAVNQLPFTYSSIIRSHLRGSKTVLDIGCGDGRFMSQINSDKKFKVYGVDLFDPYLAKAKKTAVYRKLLKVDINKMEFSKAKFDAILASQVMEHFSKKAALNILKRIEKETVSSIIIGVPNGQFEQSDLDGNKLQKHLSSWTADEFRKMGYHVYGQGLKIVYGQDGLLGTNLRKFNILRLAFFLLSYFSSPFVYIFPEYATWLIAIKDRAKDCHA